MATHANTPLTEEEYLRRERAAEFKSEFHNGWVYAMSGGSANHSLLAGAILALLRPQLRPGGRVFSSDLRVKIPAASLYTYPDCQVICGDPAITEGDNALNLLLLAEVLSPSTEAYDREQEVRALPYDSQASAGILLIHQDRRHHGALFLSKMTAVGFLRECSGKETTFEIARLDARIASGGPLRRRDQRERVTQFTHTLQISTRGKGLYPFTREVALWISSLNVSTALLTRVRAAHLPASLAIRECRPGCSARSQRISSNASHRRTILATGIKMRAG